MLKRRAILTTVKSESELSGMTPAGLALEFNLRAQQVLVMESLKRFNVLLAHRRFGKTVLAVSIALMRSRQVPHSRPQVHYYAPTYSQAKRVAWGYVHELCDQIIGCKYFESELRVALPWGASLQLGSADNPDASRGIYSDFVVLDEPAQMPARMWSEILRPALSDRLGGALFIGTPAGRNGIFYEAWKNAQGGTDPEWAALQFRASDTGLIDPGELASARRLMSESEYQQEYECSWDAAIQGAFYAEWIQRAEQEGRICPVLFRPGLPTFAALDIGMRDATAVWFFQVVGDQIRLLEYCEYSGVGAPHIAQSFRQKYGNLTTIIAPHDVRVREWGSGETRLDTLRKLGGWQIAYVPARNLMDGIDKTRALLGRCWFDAEKCAQGLECLRSYRAEYVEDKGIFKRDALHDWSSHGADALRYLAENGTAALEGWSGDLDYSNWDRSRA